MKYWEIAGKLGLVLPAGVLLFCVAGSLNGYELPDYTSLIPDVAGIVDVETVNAAQGMALQGMDPKEKDSRAQEADRNRGTLDQQGASADAAAADAAAAAAAGKKAEIGLPPAEDSNALYKDGTYVGTANGYGGAMSVQVVVKDGRIVSVAVLGNQETPEFLERAMVLCDRIVAAQSTNVDTVSGATYSSVGIIGGARNALTKAVTEHGADQPGDGAGSLSSDSGADGNSTGQLPGAGGAGSSGGDGSGGEKRRTSSQTASDGDDYYYKDGTYTGTGTGFSGDISVEVRIKNGQIVKVKITDSVDDAAFLNRAKELLPQIVAAQGTDIDAVSGATYSSNGILDAVDAALAKAVAKSSSNSSGSSGSNSGGSSGSNNGGNGSSSGGRNSTNSGSTGTGNTGGGNSSGSGSTGGTGSGTSGKEGAGSGNTGGTKTGDGDGSYYKDGTYTGTGTGFSGALSVSVTIKSGRISSVKVTDSADDAVFLNQAKGLLPQIVESQSTDIDVVSGATYSSKGILEAVNKALAKALTKSEAAEASEGKDDSSGSEVGGTDEAGESGGVGSETGGGSGDDGINESGESRGSGSGDAGVGDSGDAGNGEAVNGEAGGGSGDAGNGEAGGGDSEKDSGSVAALFADGTYRGSALCEPIEDEDGETEFDEYFLGVDIVVKDDAIIEIGNVEGYGTHYVAADSIFIGQAINGRTGVPGVAANILDLGRLTGVDSVGGVDIVSGATCSSEAIINACRDALEQAAAALRQE